MKNIQFTFNLNFTFTFVIFAFGVNYGFLGQSQEMRWKLFTALKLALLYWSIVFFIRTDGSFQRKIQAFLKICKTLCKYRASVEGSPSLFLVRALKFTLCFAFHQRTVGFRAFICICVNFECCSGKFSG